MSKIYILFFAGLFIINNCLAQETIKKRHWLTDSVIEVYQVLKSDKHTRQGLYQALFQKKIAVASGMYTNDKRTGLWQFYDTKGLVIESYNFTTNKLYYEAPEDTTSALRYFVDKQLDSTDKVTKPIKIGGRYFGYIPYLRLFKIPDYMAGLDLNNISAVVELLISPGGRLADYKVHIVNSGVAGILKTINMNTDVPDPADKVFTPATLNGEPISCRIMIKCYITDDGHLDFE